MKTVIRLCTALPILLFILSCDPRDEIIEMEKKNPVNFNMNVGNLWVYKKYDRQDYTSNFSYSGKIDSVKVIAHVTQNSLTYAKVQTKSYLNSVFQPGLADDISYWRESSLGHWVKVSNSLINNGLASTNSESVIHPGSDMSYTYTENYSEGTINYQLYALENITVENHNYSVHPYKGLFMPTPSYSYLQNPYKIVELDVQLGLGKVKLVCHNIYGTYNWEERLVSYIIN